MKEQLIHILDQSVCLSRKQMKEYLSGTMLPEEMHAAEVHLSTCPLCSMAMEGFEEHSDEALAAIASLNSGFLKDHFDNIAPQIHLNSIAPAATLPAAHPVRRRGGIQPLWRTASVAAALLLAFGALWYVEFGRHGDRAASSPSAASSFSSSPAASSPIAMADRQQPAVPDARRAVGSEAAKAMHPAPQPAAAVPPVMSEAAHSNKLAAATDKKSAEKPRPTSLDAIASSEKYADALPEQKAAADAPGESPFGAIASPATTTADEAAAKRKKLTAAKEAPASRRDGESNTGQTAGSGRAAATTPAPAPLKAKTAAPAEREEKPEIDSRSAMELGNESYDKGRYSSALAHFRRQIASGGSVKERNQATIMAARCYAALGNKAKAEELLQSIISNGAGPERRSARRTMRSLK